MEWASISKTGNQVAATNMDILNVARDEAFLYWITGEDKYAQSAASVFDVYMKGIYYRNVPKDLNHGHQQTLVGMTSFEVIHEDAVARFKGRMRTHKHVAHAGPDADGNGRSCSGDETVHHHGDAQ